MSDVRSFSTEQAVAEAFIDLLVHAISKLGHMPVQAIAEAMVSAGGAMLGSVRLPPEVKEAAERAAKDDVRSLSSLIEKLLTEHLKAKGYLPKGAA